MSPKRVIDGEGVWGSTKLGRCQSAYRLLYSWLYPLADCFGSFEITSLRVVAGKVNPVIPRLTPQLLEKVFRDFNLTGLACIWEERGRKYLHWTGSEKVGRLPRPSRRSNKYEKKLAPPVPMKEYSTYLEQFSETLFSSATDDLALDKGSATATDRAKEEGSGGFAFDGAYLKVSKRQHEKLIDGFPWVDALQEYRKMDSWLEVNPEKVPKSYPRFTHNWFNRIKEPKERQSYAQQRQDGNLEEARRAIAGSGESSGGVRRNLPPGDHGRANRGLPDGSRS